MDIEAYRSSLRQAAVLSRVPEHDIDGLVEWIVEARPTGDFLRAVLENDLKEAFGRADLENTEAMAEIMRFLYNHAPANCWGSVENVKNWRGVFPRAEP